MTRLLAVSTVFALTPACFGPAPPASPSTTQVGESSEGDATKSGDAEASASASAPTSATAAAPTSTTFGSSTTVMETSTSTDSSLSASTMAATTATATDTSGTDDADSDSTGASETTGDVCELWPTCQRDATCDSGECWLAESGWFCSPECTQDVDCDQCGLQGECVGGWCRRPCVTNKECAVGQLCDGATGTCVWSSPCGPSDDAGQTWGPCDMANGCTAAGDVCIHDGPFSICLPACPCRVDAGQVCDLLLGETACGRSGLCELPCASDSECSPGMVCGAHGICLWL